MVSSANAGASSTKNLEVQKDNPFYNIICSFVIPSVVLSQLSDHSKLGPVYALILAILFPLGFGLYEAFVFKKASFVSILGFISTALTGGFGLMELSGIWFACKEASVPAIIAILLITSIKTDKPLVKTFLYNDKVINVDLVHEALAKKSNEDKFDRLLLVTTWMLAGSFVLSSILNFGLAMVLLKSTAGTPEFNKELGTMTALSYPVIVVPSMICTFGALWWLLSGIKKLTDLTLEEIFKGHEQPKNIKQD
jgi:hypothetical protein